MTGKKQGLVVIVTLLILVQAACGVNHVESSQSGASASPSSAHTAASLQEAPHWSYEEVAGPDKWATLSPDWRICGEGRRQSPIDLEKSDKSDLPGLRDQFKPASLSIIHHEHVADVINNGHSIEVKYTEGDTLKIGDQTFQLVQYHFHSPSEHTVGGKHYPMEMHLVHKSADGKLAVIGVFIEEGQCNASFDPVWSILPKSNAVEYHLENVKVDIDNLLPGTRTIYRYDGSLTTPPCSEAVKWIIMTTPIQLSSQQIDAFRAIIKSNNRPIQALNGRSVVTDVISTR